jgi:hypothetical protein
LTFSTLFCENFDAVSAPVLARKMLRPPPLGSATLVLETKLEAAPSPIPFAYEMQYFEIATY